MRTLTFIYIIIGLLALAVGVQAGGKHQAPEKSPWEVYREELERWGRWPDEDTSLINWNILPGCVKRCVQDLNDRAGARFDAYSVTRKEFCKPSMHGASDYANFWTMVDACSSDMCKAWSHDPASYAGIELSKNQFWAQMCKNPAD